jgi:PIN domain nuclease of toxin-antitoxin system
MILLDTHVFVWLNQSDLRLTNYHRQVIEKEREDGLGISTISLIEIARLVSAE